MKLNIVILLFPNAGKFKMFKQRAKSYRIEVGKALIFQTPLT